MKKTFFSLFFLVSLILFSTFVSANFSCGTLNDGFEISASWSEVEVYYSINPHDKAFCKVSPENNRFCCDLEDIKGVSWRVGRNVFAEVFDSSEGLVAGPVSLTTTGEGFDVFPEMTLKKAIVIDSPNKRISLNTNNFFINISTDKVYSSIDYELIKISEGGVLNQTTIFDGSLCNNCDSASKNFSNLSKGHYKFVASVFVPNKGELFEEFDFFLLDFINFDRVFSCDGCKDNFIPSNSEVSVSVIINSSHKISGRLNDFFPKSWDFVDSSQEELYNEFSDSQDMVSWDIITPQDFITKDYLLKSPKIVFPRGYSFSSGFEDIISPDFKVLVYRWIRWPFFMYYPIKIRGGSYSEFNIKYKISPLEPLLLYSMNKEIFLVSIFPNKEISKVHAKILFNVGGVDNSFKIISNIKNKNIDRILIRVKLDKELVSESSEIYIMKLSDPNNKFFGSVYKEDDNHFYYEFFILKKGNYQLVY